MSDPGGSVNAYGGRTVAGMLKVGLAKGDTRALLKATRMQAAAPELAGGPDTTTLCTRPSDPKVTVADEGADWPARHDRALGMTAWIAAMAAPVDGSSGRDSSWAGGSRSE